MTEEEFVEYIGEFLSMLVWENNKYIADKIIKNTYKVLMTRGLRGCYVYCEDKPLAKYIKRKTKLIKNNLYVINEDEYYSDSKVAENKKE